MLKKFYRVFASCFTLMTLLWIAENAKNPERITVEYLYAFGIGSLLATIVSLLFYGRKMSYTKIWIVRVITLFLGVITMGGVLQFLDILIFSSTAACIKFYLRAGLGALIGAVILWIISDLMQKAALKKINAKLQKNTKDE